MNLAHICFLDFDGPLFSGKSLLLPENNENSIIKSLNLNSMVTYWKADPISISMLNLLYELRPYFLVITSSWADEKYHTKEQIESLLSINNLRVPLHKNWKLNDFSDKIKNINKWLKENKHSDYIIIDDDESADGLDDNKEITTNNLKKENIIIVDSDEGISMKNFYKMKAVIANWN